MTFKYNYLPRFNHTLLNKYLTVITIWILSGIVGIWSLSLKYRSFDSNFSSEFKELLILFGNIGSQNTNWVYALIFKEVNILSATTNAIQKLTYGEKGVLHITVSFMSESKILTIDEEEHISIVLRVLRGELSPGDGFAEFRDNHHVPGREADSHPMTRLLRYKLQQSPIRKKLWDFNDTHTLSDSDRAHTPKSSQFFSKEPRPDIDEEKLDDDWRNESCQY